MIDISIKLIDLPLYMFGNVKMLTIEALLIYKLPVTWMEKYLNEHEATSQNNTYSKLTLRRFDSL